MYLAVVPREKPHTGAAVREQPRDSPVIEGEGLRLLHGLETNLARSEEHRNAVKQWVGFEDICVCPVHRSSQLCELDCFGSECDLGAHGRSCILALEALMSSLCASFLPFFKCPLVCPSFFFSLSSVFLFPAFFLLSSHFLPPLHLCSH